MNEMFLIESGPYQGKTCFLKRKDVTNKMWWVCESRTGELLFVREDELVEYRIKRYKLKPIGGKR